MSENLARMRTLLERLTSVESKVSSIHATEAAAIEAALLELKAEVDDIRILAARLVAAETELETERKRYDLLAHTSYDAVIGMDQDGKVAVTWNPAATRIFGWTADETFGHDLADLIIPVRFRDQHRAGLKRVRAGGASTLMWTRIVAPALHKDGHEFPVEMTIGPVRDGSRFTFYAFIHDPASPVPAVPLDEAMRDHGQ